MDNETPYIKPNLLMSLSFESLLEDYRKYGRYWASLHSDVAVSPEDILTQQLVFVVGEPGQGKSRLLTELRKLSTCLQKVKLDLKLRGREETIEGLISTQRPDWDFTQDSFVLLDGLDEIAQADILHAIRRIKEYIRNNPKSNVIVASRLRYFPQYEAQFIDLNQARYVMVEPLELQQSRLFLASLGIPESKIQTVIKSLRFRSDDPLVVQNPRYLEFLAAFLKANPSITENINRATIFDSFIDNALKVEDGKNGAPLRQIKRRFLERFALTMEIAQVNSITEREFTTFLDNAKSDAKLALLAQTTVDELYVHSLLKHEDDRISFDNAEMQEYLAANAILDMKDQWHVVFELAIDPNLRELYPSWANTMSFLIDEMPELLPQLAKLKENPEDVAIDEGWHRLLTGSTSLKLTDDYKRDIFSLVSDYYFDHNLFLPDDVAFNLANYALAEQIPKLVTIIETRPSDEATKIRLINTSRILGYIASLDKFSVEQNELVKKRFIELAKSSDDTHTKREMIDALGNFKDESIIAELLPLVSSTDKSVLEALQGMARELNRNSKEAVQIFAAGMKNRESHYGRYGLLSVNSPEGIEEALKALANDSAVLFPLIEHDNLFNNEEDGFLGVIKQYWKAEWLPLLKQVVITSFSLDSGYYATRSAFIRKIIRLIGEKDDSYFSELLDATIDEKRILADELSDALASIMRESDVSVLVQAMSKNNLGRWLFSILRVLPNSGNPSAGTIEKSARSSLPEMYEEHDKAVKEYQSNGPRNPQLDALKKHIEEARQGSLPDVAEAIQALSNDNSRNDLRTVTPEDDLQFLWEEAKKNFLDPYDPANVQVKILDRNESGAVSYNASRFLNIFSLSVEYGSKTHRKDIASYRTKLINLIPFAYHDSLNAVFNTIGEMTAQEQKAFVDMYADLDTDKAQFMLGNLLEVAEKYNVHKAAPVLDKVIDLNDIAMWFRDKALELSQSFLPDIKRLQQVFDTYIKDDKTKALAIKANALLITKHNDEKSLRWLLDYVQHNAFEYVDQTQSHFVDLQEEEIHDGKIIAALKSVKDPKYIDLYLKLWDTGVGLVAKGITWENYGYYLWKAVDQYFSNLTVDGNYKPLQELEKHVRSHGDKVASARYISHLNSLKQSYLGAVGKPTAFADAVNKHNEIDAKNYISINSNDKLFEVVFTAINENWRAMVTQEGRVFKAEKKEQKYFFMELQNILMHKGFPGEGMHVLRESQAVDDTATDFLVYYNFYGPIVIELKRSKHSELHARNLKTQKSYKSMEKYMRQFGAKKGILLVYDDMNMDDKKWDTFTSKLVSAYEKISGVSVITVHVVMPEPKPTSTVI